MNIVTRFRLLFTLQAEAELTPTSDPRPALAIACAQQRAHLHQLRSGLIEVAVARQELRHQLQMLRTGLPEVEAEAHRALVAQHSDRPHLALGRSQVCLAGLSRLEGQLAEVAEDEQALTLAEQQLAERLDRLQTCCDALAACYTYAEPPEQEALYGLSPVGTDWGHVLEQAEAKIERIRYCASLLDTLLKAGKRTTNAPESGTTWASAR
jgi:phage shock protein A